MLTLVTLLLNFYPPMEDPGKLQRDNAFCGMKGDEQLRQNQVTSPLLPTPSKLGQETRDRWKCVNWNAEQWSSWACSNAWSVAVTPDQLVIQFGGFHQRNYTVGCKDLKACMSDHLTYTSKMKIFFVLLNSKGEFKKKQRQIGRETAMLINRRGWGKR